MPIRPRSSSTQTYSAANTVDVSLPANAAPGDLLVAFLAAGSCSAQPTWALPSGWTQAPGTEQHGAGSGALIAYRVCGASEPASYTFGLGAAVTGSGTIGVECYIGAHTTTPSDCSGTNAAGSGTAATAPQVTTATAGAWLVYACGLLSATVIAKDPAMTERYNAGTRTIESADELRAAAGATGTRAATWTGSKAYQSALWAIKPATTGRGRAKRSRH